MENSVCFIGHRRVDVTPQLCERLKNELLELIENGSNNFIFGDHSAFNDLCYNAVSELKEHYPQIRRIKFRKDYENANEYTMRYLIQGYEESVYPKCVSGSGKASYVKRNQVMINESEICVFYYDNSYIPSVHKRGNTDFQIKSGTAAAYKFALQTDKKINCFCSTRI